MHGDRRIALWLVVLIGSFTLLFHSSVIATSDGIAMYEVAKSIVEDGDVAITRGVVWKGRDERYYSPYGLGLSLVSIIPYALAKPVSSLTPQPETVRQAAVAVLMPIIVALLGAGLYTLSRRLGADARRSAFVGLGGVAGTFLLVYSKDFFSEPLAALFLVLAIDQAVARRPALSGGAAAAAALTRPQLFAFAPLLLWRLHADGGWRAVRRAALPLALSLAVSVAYNVARFGDPLNFGYSNPEFPQGFTTPFFTGAAGLLLHPQKSILLFAPISLLLPLGLKHLWKSQRTAFWLLTGNLAITFAISATWWAWGGGWVWGPRLLIPGVIPAIAALGPWSQRAARSAQRLATGLLVLGFLVSAPAALVGVGAQLAKEPYPPVGPSVVRQAQLLPGAVRYTMEHMFLEDSDWRAGTSRLALWQFRATRVLGRPGLLVAVIGSLLLTSSALFAAFRLRSALAATVT